LIAKEGAAALTSIKQTFFVIEKANSNSSPDAAEHMNLNGFYWIINVKLIEGKASKNVEEATNTSNDKSCPWLDTIATPCYRN
jgi:hypothetical protein